MSSIRVMILVAFYSVSAIAGQIYKPDSLNPDTANLVVVIHGCLQSTESMALGTGFNQLADENNFLVLYPQVPKGSNSLGCWSWFLPENQRADSGQLKIVMDQIRAAKQLHRLKSANVYLTGISSGATTVAGLLACFPNEFKGGAIHSGPSYGLAQNLPDAERILQDGPGHVPNAGPCKPADFRGSLIVIQGTNDLVVNPRHANRVIADFSGATSRLVMVRDLGHAWAGFGQNIRHKETLDRLGVAGVTKVPFFSTFGPDATRLMLDFWSKN